MFNSFSDSDDGRKWDANLITNDITILPHVYLGSLMAIDEKELFERNIKWIVNCCHELQSNAYPRISNIDEFNILNIPLKDKSTEELSKVKVFDRVIKFASDALEAKEAMIIHCQRGISRSAAVTIGMIMLVKQMDFDDAFDMVASKRDVINPNIGFIFQLESLLGDCADDDNDENKSKNDDKTIEITSW